MTVNKFSFGVWYFSIGLEIHIKPIVIYIKFQTDLIEKLNNGRGRRNTTRRFSVDPEQVMNEILWCFCQEPSQI